MRYFVALFIFFSSCIGYTQAPPASDRCEDDSQCASRGPEYKCRPQRFGCEPNATCVVNVCVEQKDAKPKPMTEERKLQLLTRDCERHGGKWMGSIEGRGRLTGCNEPTKDGGKACKSGEDCESVCTKAGICYGWKKYKGCGMFKGYDHAMCIE